MYVIALFLALLGGDVTEATVRERIEVNRPSNVTVDSIELGEVITVVGTSPNPNAIGNFVENLKADRLFQTPEVVSIARRKGNYDFELRLRLRESGVRRP